MTQQGPFLHRHILHRLREADAPTPAEIAAPRPGPLARVKAALTPKRPAPEPPTTPAPAPPRTPAPEEPEAPVPAAPRSLTPAEHFPQGVALPPSMQVGAEGLRIQTPYKTPDPVGASPLGGRLTKEIPAHRVPPKTLEFPPPPASASRTTWLSPTEIAAGQDYMRGVYTAGQAGGTRPHQGAIKVGLRGAWGQARAAGDDQPVTHATYGDEFADEYLSMLEGLGMWAPGGKDDPYYRATDPATWTQAQHSPQSLQRYQNRPRATTGRALTDVKWAQPQAMPDRPAYQLTPDEFGAAPYTLHRGGTGEAPKETGAMWLTPNRTLAEDYANQRLASQPRHGRSQWDESLPGATITSGMLDTSKYATEKDINAAMERRGLTMEDLRHYLPDTDGGMAPYQALYMPDILDDLRGQGYGAFEGVGPQAGPFYVKFPGTNFLQHGDVARRAHAQGLDVGDDNRKRYSLGAPRTLANGTRFSREGPPVTQTPTGPRVPQGHYTTPTSPAYEGVREAGTGEKPIPDWLKTVPPSYRWWTIENRVPSGRTVQMHALLNEDQTAVGAIHPMQGTSFSQWAAQARKWGGRLIRYPAGAPPPPGALEQPNFVFSELPELQDTLTAQQGFWRAWEMAREQPKVPQFPGQKFINPLEMLGPEDAGGTRERPDHPPEMAGILRARRDLGRVGDSLDATYGPEPPRGPDTRSVHPMDMARKEQAQRADQQAFEAYDAIRAPRVARQWGNDWTMPHAEGGTRSEPKEPPSDPLMPAPTREPPKPPRGPRTALPRTPKIPEGPSNLRLLGES